MASRILHLALSALLEKAYPFRDLARLRVGSVMPDACLTREGHFRVFLEDGRHTYALSAFRERYGERMRTDDLYLGYYLHLAEDMLQRQMLYGELGYAPTKENVRALHRDYALLNPKIIAEYGLADDVRLPDGWEEEPIVRALPFRLPEFLEEMRGDFLPPPEDGPFAVFTSALADEFLRRTADAMLLELNALREGGTTLDENALAWGKR